MKIRQSGQRIEGCSVISVRVTDVRITWNDAAEDGCG